MKTLYKIALFFILLISAGNIFAQPGERERGVGFYGQGKYSEAISIFQRLTKQKETKNDAEIWNYLGLAYLENKEYKNARKVLEKAVKLNPQSSPIRANLAYAYLLTRKINQAQSEIAKAIELDPKNVAAYYLRGTARLWEGKLDEALTDVDKMIGIDPKYEAAYTLKSDTLVAIFGKNVSESSSGKNEIEYLRKAVEALEYCLKNCRPESSLTRVREKLEAVNAFYEYFSRKKTAETGQTFTEGATKTPVKILQKVFPRYTDKAREANISGVIKLYLLFAANGKISHIIVLKGLGYGLDEQALIAARQIKFEPATENGKPVSVVKMVAYSFTIY
jgi:TonB family protein